MGRPQRIAYEGKRDQSWLPTLCLNTASQFFADGGGLTEAAEMASASPSRRGGERKDVFLSPCRQSTSPAPTSDLRSRIRGTRPARLPGSHPSNSHGCPGIGPDQPPLGGAMRGLGVEAPCWLDRCLG